MRHALLLDVFTILAAPFHQNKYLCGIVICRDAVDGQHPALGAAMHQHQFTAAPVGIFIPTTFEGQSDGRHQALTGAQSVTSFE